MLSAFVLSAMDTVREVFVAGIPTGSGEKAVREALERYGPVEYLTVKKGKGKSDDFAFAVFKSDLDARRAVNDSQAKSVKMGEAKLIVRWSQSNVVKNAAATVLPSMPQHATVAAAVAAVSSMQKPGPGVRGWQCRDPSCTMWNEDVSPSCVQCHLLRPPQHNPMAAAAAAAAVSPVSGPYGRWNASSSTPTSSVAGSSGGYRPPFPVNPPQAAGRGRGARTAERQHQQPGVIAPPVPQTSPSQSPSSSSGDPELKAELQRVKNRCQQLEKELAEAKKRLGTEGALLGVCRLRIRLDRKRHESSGSGVRPTLVAECASGLARAMECCSRSQPKVYDQVRKGLNYYRSLEVEEEEREKEDDMNRLARESAAKALSVSMSQYLSTCPTGEIISTLSEVESLSERLLEARPLLRTAGPKPVGGACTPKEVEERFKSSAGGKHCMKESAVADREYEKLCEQTDELASTLRGDWGKKFDVAAWQASAQRAKEAMEDEESKWKGARLASNNSSSFYASVGGEIERLRDLYGHLAWIKQRLAQAALQYKDIYRTAKDMEEDFGLSIVGEEAAASSRKLSAAAAAESPVKEVEKKEPEKEKAEPEGSPKKSWNDYVELEEEEAQVVVPADSEEGDKEEEEDDNLSDVLSFSDEEEESRKEKEEEKTPEP